MPSVPSSLAPNKISLTDTAVALFALLALASSVAFVALFIRKGITMLMFLTGPSLSSTTERYVFNRKIDRKINGKIDIYFQGIFWPKKRKNIFFFLKTGLENIFGW